MSIDQERKDRIERLIKSLPNLTGGQLRWIESIVEQFSQPSTFTRGSKSNLITPCMLQDFGDALRIHHCFSVEPFRKDRFEYVLQRVTTLCGKKAELAPSGNPGYCYVSGSEGEKYQLYFDGGTERKLQIKHLKKVLHRTR